MRIYGTFALVFQIIHRNLELDVNIFEFSRNTQS